MWPYKELLDPVQIIVHMCFDQSVQKNQFYVKVC